MYNSVSIVSHFSESLDKATGAVIDGQTVIVNNPDGSSYAVALYSDEIKKLINGEYEIHDNSSQVQMIDVEYVLIHPDAIVPYKKRPTDAGYDVYAIEDGCVAARGALNVKTGIAISVQRGQYYTIEGRSGLGIDELIIPFSGTLDATYTGEVKVLLLNFSDKPYYFKKHDRIAQIVFHNQIDARFNKKTKFSPNYDKRGTAGFGSSGK